MIADTKDSTMVDYHLLLSFTLSKMTSAKMTVTTTAPLLPWLLGHYDYKYNNFFILINGLGVKVSMATTK